VGHEFFSLMANIDRDTFIVVVSTAWVMNFFIDGKQ
jgi:hypothetical protein